MPKVQRTKFWFYPYGPSQSVDRITEALPGKIIRREGSRYTYHSGDLCVNWGSSAAPVNLRGVHTLNPFEAVRVATSKLASFQVLKDQNVRIPEFTLDKLVAGQFNSRVFGRDLDRGSKGRGITVYERGTPLGNHQFYVKYWRKQREFRVHAFHGQIIFVQEKLRKNGAELAGSYSPYIRSHDRGWCFAFNHLGDRPVPAGVLELGSQAVRALGLDFGACDIGWNERSGAACFEVNTAPGIETSSLQAYVNAFRSL